MCEAESPVVETNKDSLIPQSSLGIRICHVKEYGDYESQAGTKSRSNLTFWRLSHPSLPDR